MALEVGPSNAIPRVNGTLTPSQAEDAELYDRLLKLRDVILAGQHSYFKLPESTIAELKASIAHRSAQDHGSALPQPSGAVNDAAIATNQTQLQIQPTFPTFTGLPGLQPSPNQHHNGVSLTSGAQSTPNTTLDPIFLEKSESLVRAEGQLKRQRLERELQSQLDQRKHASRDKDPATDALSPIDVDLVYLTALERVRPVSGLKEAGKAGSAASSSFDENDYYSSQVQSEFSSEAGSSEGGVGAFTADFERLDGGPAPTSLHKKRHSHGRAPPVLGSSAQPAEIDSQDEDYEPGEVVEIDDEDDDYTPPDAAAFDSSRDYAPRANAALVTPPEDDNSDYEPGEITDSNIVTPALPNKHPVAQKSPNVPIVRNHLTHLVAPQPNRVSPLATAKSQTIELELVNGRPEVVQKPVHRSNYPYTRASTASPSGNGISGSNKKRRNKKRKRDHEPAKHSKRSRRERQNAYEEQYNQDPFIKDEPMSPPPFAAVPEPPQYPRPQYVQHRPTDLDLTYARPAPHYHYVPEPSSSGLRFEHDQPATPTVVRIASPTSPAYRSVQRDTQDLRRVASLHHAQRPPSPAAYSPAGTQRTVSMTYGQPRSQLSIRPEANGAPQYTNTPAQDVRQYSRAERSRSPPQAQEYRGHYAERVHSPAMMPPPPPVAQRQVVVDQHGNRFYLEEPTPPSASMPGARASAAPAKRRIHSEMLREVVPGRNPTAYATYDPANPRIAPPPAPSRRPEQPLDYIDSSGYSTRGYTLHAGDPPRYAQAPTSPIYQEIRGYDTVPPPPAPTREPTSPVYVSRSYSTRPDEVPQPAANYMRHASVAPAQYGRQDAPTQQQPMRAVSVMPGLEYAASAQPRRSYYQAAQNVRYVDQNGNEVFPSQVRQVSEFGYQ
jgi:hypothetical protein